MTNKDLLDDRAGLAIRAARAAPPSPVRMAAVAALIALGAYSPTAALALGLGQITVLSALGEPLRAEIDIIQITPDEASSLKTGIPGPAAFRAAGVEYNPALAKAAITLEKRPDGRPFLRLTSETRVDEPFVDLILEAQWAAGRVVRDYTLLFDPPSTRQAGPATPVAAQLPAPSSPRPSVPLQGGEMAAGAMPGSRPTSAPPAAPVRSARAPSASPAPKVAAPVAAAGREASDGKSVTVKTGDTAGKIAAAYKSADVSLDQMLVALLRSNPDAFIDGNVNRIKAGAVVDLPAAGQASSVTPEEARKTLSVQSASFDEYRRKLAEAAPARQTAAAGRQASGSVQTRVEEKKPAAASPDKLTLSKGAVKGAGPEAQIAKSRQTREEGERVAELSKNITELSRLQDKSAVAGATAAPAASAPRGPALPVGTPASAVKPAAAPLAAASAPAAAATVAAAPGLASSAPAKPSASATTTPAASVTAVAAAPASSAQPAALPASSAATSTPTTASASSASASAAMPAEAASAALPASAAGPAIAASAASAPAALPASRAKPAAAAKPAAPPPSFVDEMLDNPLVPAGALGLIALLAGYGFYRARQRKKATQVDSSFLESRLQPDSFFGSSGGQRVDTTDATDAAESVHTGSSLAYSHSQLDAAGDVDPVAEADVYLAYGRDLQAEEILKEALRMNPSRVAIHGKLLEIYAKRRDTRAFELIARDAFKLTGGEGPEWERICEFGRELDNANALYQPGGQPKGEASTSAFLPPASPSFGPSTIPAEPHPEFDASMPVDLDLGDLDLSLTSPTPPAFDAGKTVVTPRPAFDAVKTVSTPPPAFDPGKTVITPPQAQPDPGLQWDHEGPAGSLDQTTPMTPVIDLTTMDLPLDSAPEAAKADAGMIEFDLGSLSLDLDQAPESPKAQPASEIAQASASDPDPLQTKLALAQEFHAIGDADGARALVEEVVGLASGPLKAKAQRFLAELG